ncbi:MAG: flagellar biosynthetic protein FliO [Myxococcota bacterium]
MFGAPLLATVFAHLTAACEPLTAAPHLTAAWGAQLASTLSAHLATWGAQLSATLSTFAWKPAVFLQAGAATEPAELPGGYGAALLQGVISLAAVCLLAWVVLKALSSRGFGQGNGRALQVIDRVALDARRSLVVVKVADRTLLIGTGDGAAPNLIAELDGEALPEAPPARSFADVLADLRGKSDSTE